MEHILIIDDDKELCTLMKKCVEKEGWFAMVAHNGLEGLKFLDEYREGCVLIILDVVLCQEKVQIKCNQFSLFL